ncbi:Vacuolar protein sorting-associated protein 28 homolog [Caenorhabditis elegans]|uniref:Vacuolar protein sorting-associated protein 28 homolog n=1 Tax=Caenorhabditis elegans TaxID=6239 RepID=VPS28_CAEEL|nr:Vacuolar protein sorting-associated protein 28 homolog [Caenorhabditis elegans]Q9NA26.1 RecName: Full=Vacuolar protein sorting-associated protein 28 homolog; AltName: Full=ESCRT-I complex subunit VPS28 [Caenorhabditis elegans]CAB54493.1 Vacuolar protein sorting-associated protein 28 homolog [Caenorhabditis elegans]|eukprot:NP_493382.1 Vacuolar protein sorting-associated protein 28 homolog [Caenorhabditis elegans]
MSSQNANLMREVRLFENHSEREQMENLSELFAVLNALEHLEKMFSRDHVSADEYKSECFKLIDQYKVTMRLVHGATSIEDFAKKYRLHCPAAIERIREGRPITVKDDQGNVLKHIASIVEQFITFLDALRLNTRAVDDLYPGLDDLYNAINTTSRVPIDAIVTTKVKKWHDRLSSMAASDEISDEDARQMIFDVESAYQAFNKALNELKH